jgi:hypothetical protein
MNKEQKDKADDKMERTEKKLAYGYGYYQVAIFPI